ncbi:mucus-binding protein, partial [Lactobacillus reuteri]|uniref:mucin-binding protein n=1 Tax=Limosilactobacillus reuteri TaxID=1598 RepID=UPI001E1959F8|nr:mucus-binding protein [Limosilactobacillus reuteri]
AKNDLEATGTQTIHYEGAGDKTPANNTQHFTFTKSATVDKVTGKIVSETGWNVAGHTFGNVDTPVVAGYHADKKVAGGATITPDDLNKTIVVTYAPNGHIIPVDPDGKPLPNVPQPQYQNNPNDPTEVTPNEPVPEILGYTPNVSTVTPKDPGKDTQVIYTQQGSVTVTVHDVTDNLDLPYGKTSGEENVGTTFTYDKNKVIQELENKGYKILNPDVVIPTTISKGAQNIVIKVKHELVPVTPGNQGQQWPDGIAKNDLEATGTQTIHYEGAGDKTPANNTQHFTFTKSATVDKVTGKIVSETGWNVAGHTFGNVDTPVVAGYHADKKVAGGATITPDDLNKTIVVTYAPNGHIIPVDPDGKPLPNVPQPQYQNNPNDPTEVTPNEPVPEIPGYTPNVSTVTPENPGENTPVVYTPNKKTVGPTTPQPETPAKPMTPTTTPAGNGNIPANGQTTSPAGSSVTTSNVNKANATTPVAQKQAAQLPQTGNEQLKHERILGLLALGVAGLLVFGKMRRKE